jgi:hypothetical protein
MAHFPWRKKLNRSFRLEAHPSLYSCAVRYCSLGESNNPRWAQFADISETGMKLISTKPHQTEVGSIVDVNFSLVGGEREVSKKARVVRQGNEFVLGLQFLQNSEDYKFIFWQHAQFVNRLPWSLPLKNAMSWFKEHRIGLRIAVAATIFFVLTSTIVYIFSDGFAGRKRPFGSRFPDSIDYEYVNEFKFAE